METKCPEGICDGSGYITVGQYDDLREERCACNPKISMEELMDDDSDLEDNKNYQDEKK